MVKFKDKIKKNSQPLSVREKAEEFIKKQIKKKEFVVNFHQIGDKKVQQFLKYNDILYSPCKGIHIIKSELTTNKEALDRNYFNVISKLGGIVGGEIALNYHTGNTSKIKEIDIITTSKNGEVDLGDGGDYTVRYQKSTIYRDVELALINGAKIYIEKSISYLINNFNEINISNPNYTILLSSTHFDIGYIEKIIQKGANISALSGMALWYKDNNSSKNYSIIKTAITKSGRSINYNKGAIKEGGDTISKLLNSTLEYNIDPEPIKNPKLSRFENYIDKLDKECDKYLKSIDISDIKYNTLGKLLYSIEKNIVYDSYHSLTIENYHVSEAEIDILNNPEKNEDVSMDIEDKLATKGYLKAYKCIVEQIKANFGHGSHISKELLIHVNKLLFSDIAKHKGFKQNEEYRNNNIEITGTSHLPTNHKLVPEFMEKFIEYINNIEVQSTADVIKKSVMAHFLFVYIHPFSDGNGRVGRFLLNYCLGSDKLDWITILSDNKKEYIDCLKKGSEDGNILPFISLIIDYLRKID